MGTLEPWKVLSSIEGAWWFAPSLGVPDYVRTQNVPFRLDTCQDEKLREQWLLQTDNGFIWTSGGHKGFSLRSNSSKWRSFLSLLDVSS